MEDSSQYGEILGFFDRNEAHQNEEQGDGIPEPQYTQQSMDKYEFNATMVQINEDMETSTQAIIEPSSSPISNMGDRGNLKLTISEVGSLHELYSKYIGKNKPQDHPKFDELMEIIQANLDKTLSDEERTQIKGDININMGELIETLTRGWMTPIYEALSNNNKTITSHLKDMETMAENALKIFMTFETTIDQRCETWLEH